MMSMVVGMLETGGCRSSSAAADSCYSTHVLMPLHQF